MRNKCELPCVNSSGKRVERSSSNNSPPTTSSGVEKHRSPLPPIFFPRWKLESKVSLQCHRLTISIISVRSKTRRVKCGRIIVFLFFFFSPRTEFSLSLNRTIRNLLLLLLSFKERRFAFDSNASVQTGRI